MKSKAVQTTRRKVKEIMRFFATTGDEDAEDAILDLPAREQVRQQGTEETEEAQEAQEAAHDRNSRV